MKINLEEEFEKMNQRIRTLMDSIFQQMSPWPVLSGSWIPDMDVFETDKELIIIIDAAGVNKEDFNITLEGNILRISGYRNEPVNPYPRRPHQIEIHYGPFERVYRLPCAVKTEGIAASYRNGLLEIRLPKKGVTVVKKIEERG